MNLKDTELLNFFKETVTFIRNLYNQPEGFIPLHAPVFKGNEKKYLEGCINSTFVSSIGKFVDQFEKLIAEYTKAEMAVACVNGTNALHIALKIVGVERETEVITQPLTFIATANAITYCGAQPVFLDVDLDTLGLSSSGLKKWLDESTIQQFNNITHQSVPINKTTGKRISACVPMHTFGHPVRIDEIVAICNAYNIPVIEDAAESLGSFFKEKHTGTYGKIGVISFNGNKILTTGGGGMLLFIDEELGLKAKHLTTQAKVPHPWEFIHDEIGYNYRMPNINAALGLAQLEQLPLFLQSKRKIAGAYKNFFSTSPSTFVSEPPNSQSNYWLNSILLRSKEERETFLKYTNDNGIMTRPAWVLLNKLPMFENCVKTDLSNAQWIEDRLVNLPSGIIPE